MLEHAAVPTLQAAITDSMRQAIDRDAVALIGFPVPRNVGDCAIWLGERRILRRLDIATHYASRMQCHSDSVLARRIGDGPILLHGGGNFGDLWPRHHEFRLHVVRTFRRNPIVQLPVTMNFSTPELLDETVRVFNGHPAATLMLRDRRSFELAAERFTEVRVVLAPDGAFGLGHLPGRAPEEAEGDVLWLARRDHESSGYEPPNDDGIKVVDWRDIPVDRLERARRRTTGRVADSLGHARGTTPLSAWRARAFDSLATRFLDKGTALLGSARVVVTDRLHGHILSMLMGRPHVVLRDRHGKVEGFWSTWTAGTGVPLAATPEAALEEATRVAGVGLVE